MNKRIDFSDCKLSDVFYGGSEKKKGIVFQGEKYMLKFAKKNIYGECFNDVAEYLCSTYLNMIGINAQQTILGYYNAEKVVACRDFVSGYKFHPFDSVGDSSIDDDRSRYRYRYKDIEEIINKDKKIKNKEEALLMFWKTYIMDALFANPDRHGKNWGYLISGDNEHIVAPIFDNGSCLFSGFSDEEEMTFVVNDEEEMLERVFDTPMSLILYDTTISDYYSVISSLEFERCNKALMDVFPRINLSEFSNLVDSTDLSNIRKTFIKNIVRERYDRILKYSFKKLVNRNENNY